jgi:hypothetical protein
MYYYYVEIEYVATSFSPARMDLALKLLTEMFSTDIAKAQVRISVNQCFIFYMNSYKRNSKS